MQQTAAESLEGVQLDSGWRVVSKQDRPDGHTGGNFSVGYIAEGPDGQPGFLKALDFERVLQSAASDPARAMQHATEAFNYERDLLVTCRDAGLSRIVRLLTQGTYQTPASKGGSGTPVQYMVFELADSDVRGMAALSRQMDYAWTLKVLHDTAVGVKQLHGHRISHQDIKPSNVLLFQSDGAKLGDLGRSVDGRSPDTRLHETLPIAGALPYAPPEALYGYIPQDWHLRRAATDFYQFGNLAYFFFTGSNVTAETKTRLNEAHTWESWGGAYQEVLPYLIEAFDSVIAEFQPGLPDNLASELRGTIYECCHPDPHLRGISSTRPNAGMLSRLDRIAAERLVSRLDRLRARTEIEVRRLARR